MVVRVVVVIVYLPVSLKTHQFCETSSILELSSVKNAAILRDLLNFLKLTRWKGRGGKSQRREEKKKDDQKRERVRGKKMQACEKVEKSRNTVFFRCFVAPRVEK